MKNKVLLLIILPCLLTSCNFDNTLPNEEFKVTFKLDPDSNKVKVDCDFDYSNVKLYDEEQKKFPNNQIMGGDKLTVYYTDNSMNKIDHVIVNPCEVLQVDNRNVPGLPLDEFQIYAEGWVLDYFSQDCKYVINSDFSTTLLKNVPDRSTLYAIYNDFEERSTAKFCEILYLFSFNPKA